MSLREDGPAVIFDLCNTLADWPAEAWAEVRPHVAAEVFSCSVGLRKPDPRIYLLACEELGVEPAEALFVGDGDNDELAGAERVGMTAVLLERPGMDREWTGRRIQTLAELLALV